MSGLAYLEGDCIVGWVPPGNRFWDGISHAGYLQRSALRSNTLGADKRGDKAGMDREKSRWVAGPTTALYNPRGALDLEWPFRVIPSWAQMAWPLISHTVLSLNMVPHNSQGNPWRGWQLKAVCWKHSQELGQQVLHWRKNWEVYHDIHHRSLLKLSISLVSIQI